MPMEFLPVRLEKQNEYIQRLAQCTQVPSDYSFINLWGWGPEYGLQWAWTDELVWLKQTVPNTKLWAPIGNWQSIDWPSAFRWLADESIGFTRIPEELKTIWLQQLAAKIDFQEVRSHWDYVYLADDLINLSGNRYHKKKNLYNQFVRKQTFEFVQLQPAFINQAIEMQNNWCEWRDCESSDMLAAENRAIQKTLASWQQLQGILGGAITVANRMVAYTVAEKVSDDTVIIHFEKGNPEYKGIYQAINQMFLADLDRSIQWVNREQDLGDQGLRKAKLSYHPHHHLKKYRAHWKA
jgi:hypothetical protein